MSTPSASEALTPATALVDRFRRDLTALTGEAPSADRKLGLAVSGGADSLALLLLAAAAFPGTVLAVTVDHGLRSEAAAEARAVAEACRRLGVPHETLTIPDNIVSASANIQESARERRYLTLHFWANSGMLSDTRLRRVEWLATAHQRDDVAETFLMRARRGAGVGGLATMRGRRSIVPGLDESVALVRPLLGWPRADLAALVATAGLTPVNDPFNVHPRFDRSRIRALLARERDLPTGRLALAAGNLRHAEDALEWITVREWVGRHEIVDRDTVWLDPAGLPYELRRRLVRRAVACLHEEIGRPGIWRGTGLDRLVAALDAGAAATLADVAASPGPRWRFTLAPPRRKT